MCSDKLHALWAFDLTNTGKKLQIEDKASNKSLVKKALSARRNFKYLKLYGGIRIIQ
jgi:hypothetical protein